MDGPRPAVAGFIQPGVSRRRGMIAIVVETPRTVRREICAGWALMVR